jgi:hypothetical protein
VTVLAVVGVFAFIPQEIEKRINEKAPKLLEMNGYKIIQVNGFDKWKDQTEYIVDKSGKRDTVEVRFFKGQVTIQPK